MDDCKRERGSKKNIIIFFSKFLLLLLLIGCDIIKLRGRPESSLVPRRLETARAAGGVMAAGW